MATEVTMPQLSDTMNEGRILSWKKKEGESVARGDALAEVATDKADLEIESFFDGVLLKIHAPVGSTVKVGSIIATIGNQGESVSEQSNATQPPSAPQPTVPEHREPSPPTMQSRTEPIETSADDRVKISPLARNLAKSHGVDYSALHGSGDGGRITRRDVEQHLEQQQGTNREQEVRSEPAYLEKSVSRTETLSTMRQTIARRMVESVTTIPHFYVTTAIRMDEAIRLKNSLKTLPQYQGVSFNHLVIRASALALREVLAVNASYQNGNIVQAQDINIGIVTAVNGGLLIPVLKRADQLSFADLVSEARGLVHRARSGRPKGEDLSGGTFSISNLGMFPIENFTAIISPGQGAILAVGAIADEAVVVNDRLEIGNVLRVTLSVDHRIIDGVGAGEFVKELKRLLEDPVLLVA